MAIVERVHLNRDNTVDLCLKEGGIALTVAEMSAITRMVLKVGSVTVDSDDDPDCFDWTSGVAGKVILDLGPQTLLVGANQARLIVYSADNANGLAWGNEPFEIIVGDDF